MRKLVQADRLSPDRAHSIRRQAVRDYVLGKINENLYLSTSQRGRIYRAQVDRIDISVEQAERRAHTTAVSGGTLTLEGQPLSEGGSQ